MSTEGMTTRRQRAVASEGFAIPKGDVYLSAKQFWTLTNEGWFLYLDEDGKVLGYVAPRITLRKRLEQPDGI